MFQICKLEEEINKNLAEIGADNESLVRNEAALKNAAIILDRMRGIM